jgi:hypothetical protein
MKKRQHKRFNTRFHAIILSNNNSYAGFIENVSEDGVGYIMSTFKKALEDLLPGKKINLVILTPSGDTLNLRCEIRWTNTPSEMEKLCLGAKIVDPPIKYKEFLKTLD